MCRVSETTLGFRERCAAGQPDAGVSCTLRWLAEAKGEAVQHAGQARDIVVGREDEAGQALPRLLPNQPQPRVGLKRSVDHRVDIHLASQGGQIHIQGEEMLGRLSGRPLNGEAGILLGDPDKIGPDPSGKSGDSPLRGQSPPAENLA